MKLTRLLVALVSGAVLTLAAPAGPARAQAQAAPPDPATDPFFTAPANLASLEPGDVIRKRSVPAKIIGRYGVALPMLGVSSYQILVRSTDAKGLPAAVTATVLVPKIGAKGQLLSYQPATDSLGAKCEPSYGLQTGEEKETAIIALALGAGLTVVVPDHQGPRHAYAAGRMAGHATLDGIRGAVSLSEAKLRGAATKAALVGYSGGAIATGWAAQLHATYAGELNIVGVASGGTPADLAAAKDSMDGSLLGGLFVAAAIGMSREYPELRSVFNDEGLALIEEVKDKCNADFLLEYPFASIAPYSDAPDPLSTPVATAVLADNKMGSLPPRAPVLLWHSRFDQAVPYDSVVALERDWCSRGARVDLRTNYLSEHIVGAAMMVPEALPWLLDRLNGKPATGTC